MRTLKLAYSVCNELRASFELARAKILSRCYKKVLIPAVKCNIGIRVRKVSLCGAPSFINFRLYQKRSFLFFIGRRTLKVVICVLFASVIFPFGDRKNQTRMVTSQYLPFALSYEQKNMNLAFNSLPALMVKYKMLWRN